MTGTGWRLRVPLIVLLTCLGLRLAPAEGPDANFHLYLLIGQSNMAGRGKLDEDSRKVHPRVVMLTKDLRWVPATEPLHFDKPGIAGVGPGLTFGQHMAEANPQVRIGLVPSAVGGTSIKAWVPAVEDAVTKTHPYDDMLERIRAATRAGVLKGVLWHQGESDRGDARHYGQRLRDLIERLRRDLGAPDVPFLAGELTAFEPSRAKATSSLNDAIRGLTGTVKHYDCVSAEGLQHGGDLTHYDAESARTLGRRFAEKMIGLQNGR